MIDKFGKIISQGDMVVYPTRPGGKGPLQLGFGKVTAIHDFVLVLDTGSVQGEVARKVVIKQTERVALVTV